MSLAEIVAAIKSHARREKLRGDEYMAEARQLASLLYRHANLVAVATWEGRKYPSLERAFPGLFKTEENEEAPVPRWKRQQAGMAAWVAAYNARIAQRKGVAGHDSSADAGNQG